VARILAVAIVAGASFDYWEQLESSFDLGFISLGNNRFLGESVYRNLSPF